MAVRSLASLTISFGLVSIPVKQYTATQATGSVHFNLLHKDCGSRLKQQYLCLKEEIPVAREEMVKGYEFAKDQYVVFEAQELKALEEAGTRAIDITEFVPASGVDPVYFDKAYYLAPDKGGAKPYALLTKALRESGLCALGRWAARGKQYIVMLRPVAQGLVMQQLLYDAEVRDIEELEIPQAEVKDAELKLAMQLIQQGKNDAFHPEAYKDEVRERIEAAVEKKIEGQQISIAEEPPASGGAQVIDLMEALRASLSNQAVPIPGKSDDKPVRKAPKRVQREPVTAKRAVKK